MKSQNDSMLMPRPKLWTPEDLADYLGVPVSWVYKRTRKSGPELIPHIKLGKYIRFDPESNIFQEWLADHQMDSRAESGANNLTIDFPSNKVRLTEKTGQHS